MLGDSGAFVSESQEIVVFFWSRFLLLPKPAHGSRESREIMENASQASSPRPEISGVRSWSINETG